MISIFLLLFKTVNSHDCDFLKSDAHDKEQDTQDSDDYIFGHFSPHQNFKITVICGNILYFYIVRATIYIIN